MKILDTEVQLVDNLKKSLLHYKIFWLLFLISVILDVLSTYYFMKVDGIEHEANKLIRSLAYTLGVFPGVVVGKSLQIVAALIFCSLSFKLSRTVLLLFIALNLLASFHNLSFTL